MSTSLSKLVDSLSESSKKECKRYKDTKSNQYAILLGLKIINCIANKKNVKKDGENQ